MHFANKKGCFIEEGLLVLSSSTVVTTFKKNDFNSIYGKPHLFLALFFNIIILDHMLKYS